MLRPKRLGRIVSLYLLAGGISVFSSLMFAPGVYAQSPYATPSIESVGSRGQCITDYRDYLQPGNAVFISKCDGDYGQYWHYYSSDLEISFQHDHGYCLAPFNHSSAVNERVVLEPCSGTGIFWNNYEGGYKNRLTGLCLSANGPNDVLRQVKCSGEINQKWNDPDYLINPNLCGNTETANPVQARCIALDLMQIYPYFWNPYQPVTLSNGQTASQWYCLDMTWYKESHWQRIDGYPDHSYGIPQADPATSDYVGVYKDALPPDNSAIVQIKWGLAYIAQRYTYPCGAWEHELAYNWYVVNTQQD